MGKHAFGFRPVRRISFIAALIATTLLLSKGGTKAAFSGSGQLDQTFGDEGKIVGPIGINGWSATVVQPDGKILLVGTFASWISMEFAVMRLLPDGSPDATFGPGDYGVPGQVETDFSGRDDYASTVVLLADGTIVVGGAADCSPYGQYECGFGLAWYSPHGTELSRVTTFFDTSAGVNSLALQNGKIVAAGGPYLARYDGSFLEGTVTTKMEWILNVVLQPDGGPGGKLVASGWCRTELATYFSCMARFSADGSLDTTFGADGWVTDVETIFGALTLQADGKLVVAGARSGDFILARYNPGGNLDTSFGTGGRVSTDFGNADRASAVALQPDGKIIVAGTTAMPALHTAQFALARYDAGGSLDFTFGSLGKVTTGFDFPNYTEWEVRAITVQPDGKIIAAGFGQWPGIVGGPMPAMARYLPGADQHSPLASLSIAPTSVISGEAATGTVTLAVAQTSDVSVALIGDDAAFAAVPPSVTVPAGSTSVTFAVSTIPVFTTTGIEIRASLGDATRYASLLLHAQTSLSDVLVDPSVVGGNRAAGTVCLARAPGSTEAVEVTLASSNPAVASVPASAIVPADVACAGFAVSTSSVAATTTVTISATYRTTKSAVHTIRAATISSVTLSPAAVPAGSPSNGMVTLTGVAPPGAAVVALSSSNPATATVLASVTVAAGQTSANFTVSTGVCASGSVIISVTSAAVTKSAALAVTSAADTVTIQRAQYSTGRRELRVEGMSTRPTAILDVFVTSSAIRIGALTNVGGGDYAGRFTWPANPQNITVRSTLCGSATSQVTLR
jgi:uncharacterized delta-60 repeat protein